MNKKIFWGLVGGAVVFATLAATRTAWLDIEDLTFLRPLIPKVNLLAKEKNAVYENACASCHMLYMPTLLPARSWKQMMGELDNHFGDNAEMNAKDTAEVSAYLQAHAGDKVDNHYAVAMTNLLKDGETPSRITDTAYYKFLHDVVSPAMVTGNPKVTSYARCSACHHEALGGRFNKYAVRIPGYYKEGIWKLAPEEPVSAKPE